MFNDNNFFSGGAAEAGFYDHPIEQSLRFNEDDNAYLSWTPASAGNRKTWTWSGWVKLSEGNTNTLFSAYTDANNMAYFHFTPTSLRLYGKYGGTAFDIISTDAVFRDYSAWYHVVAKVDTTQATASDRIQLYVNGNLITDSAPTYPPQNQNLEINNSTFHGIGYRGDSTSYDLHGYLAEVHFIDGTALDATSFGETKSGVWIPKAYAGSYGTNGFYLDFDGTYYNDKSGNGNNFTANNLAATDVVLDSPTNNFATWNVLANINGDTFSEGNIKVSTAASPYSYTPSSIGISSSKVYSEFYISSTSGADMFGIVTGASTSTTIYIGQSSEAWGYRGWTGQVVNGGTVSSYGNTFTTGDIVGIAVDLDNGYVYWSINGTWQNSADPTSGASGTGGINISSISGKDIFFAYSDFDTSATPAVYIGNFGQDSSFAGNKTAQGNTDANGYGDFYYAPPTGYLALCTANLTVPDAMNPALDNSPQDYFNTVLWTGNQLARSIDYVGFQPDLVWCKARGAAESHRIMDSVRGKGTTYALTLTSNSTAGDAEDSLLTDITSEGFDIAAGYNSPNVTGRTYAAWNWKAGGSGVSNTDGSITSTVSANTDAGFSIVSYTGNGSSSATVGHGLTQAPDMIIGRARNDVRQWFAKHKDLSTNTTLCLNLTNAEFSPSDGSYGELDNASTFDFYLGSNVDNVNRSGYNYIAYCFHSVEGFSKAFSYTGNGSADGPMIYCGFKPSWVMIKIATGDTGQWVIYDTARDTYNAMDLELQAESSNAENQLGSNPIDCLSNGFKIRSSTLRINRSTSTFIGIAFAESPFKFSTAR